MLKLIFLDKIFINLNFEISVYIKIGIIIIIDNFSWLT
jgi:hypothetical protein